MVFETLETQRLILRKLTPEVLNDIFENYQPNEIKTMLGHQSELEFEKERNKYEKGYTTYNRSFLSFQIVYKSTQTIIGGCGFHNWYPDHNRAEIGYALINDDYKNRGIMSEALASIIDYGYDQMQLHRIEAMVGTENTASLKLMEKFNFTKEGLLKEHYFIDGKFEDSLVFGRLNPNRLK